MIAFYLLCHFSPIVGRELTEVPMADFLCRVVIIPDNLKQWEIWALAVISIFIIEHLLDDYAPPIG